MRVPPRPPARSRRRAHQSSGGTSLVALRCLCVINGSASLSCHRVSCVCTREQESSSGEPSATSLCLVTLDGQRIRRTCLGASLGLQSAAQLACFDWTAGCRLLHCTGYCLYRPQLTREMMALAKAAGALVSIDLASFEVRCMCVCVYVCV